MTRFGRNQHQILVWCMFHITQETNVEDYVHQFAKLVDQIAAYEPNPNPVHYTACFLDGLFPAVRVLVAIQQPKNLDITYTLGLLYEELGEGMAMSNSSPSLSLAARRTFTLPLLPTTTI